MGVSFVPIRRIEEEIEYSGIDFSYGSLRAITAALEEAGHKSVAKMIWNAHHYGKILGPKQVKKLLKALKDITRSKKKFKGYVYSSGDYVPFDSYLKNRVKELVDYLSDIGPCYLRID